jgi:ABC-type transporter Mla MlaB component
MPVEFKNNTAKFIDVVTVEDAETLFNWLIERKKPKIDLTDLNHIHTACLQLLLVFKPEITKLPDNEDLRQFLNFLQKEGGNK